MQLGAPRAGERLLDHAPGELVAEPDDAAVDDEQPALLARGEPVRRAGLAHEPQLRGARHDRDELERRPCVRVEPARAGEHRVAHRRRRQLAARGDAPR